MTALSLPETGACLLAAAEPSDRALDGWFDADWAEDEIRVMRAYAAAEKG